MESGYYEAIRVLNCSSTLPRARIKTLVWPVWGGPSTWVSVKVGALEVLRY